MGNVFDSAQKQGKTVNSYQLTANSRKIRSGKNVFFVSRPHS